VAKAGFPEDAVEEVAHDAAVKMLEEKDQAKVKPLSGDVEVDLEIMRNWVYKIIKNMWLQLRDERERERTGHKKYEIHVEGEELDDCGSRASRPASHTPIEETHMQFGELMSDPDAPQPSDGPPHHND
jgi:hypothetical protein